MYYLVRSVTIFALGFATWKLIENSTPASIAIGAVSAVLAVLMVVDFAHRVMP